MSLLERCPTFIDGEWKTADADGTSPVFNPSRGEIIAEVPMCGAAVVHEAVEAAAVSATAN